MKLLPKLCLYIIFITCLIFLFIDGPDWYSPLPVQKAWDLGHILLFFIGGILFLTDFRRYFKDTFLWHLLIVVVFTLILGLLTEMIQVRFHRDPDMGDLIRDLLGGCTAVFFFSPRRRDLPAIGLRSFKFVLIIAVVLEAWPLIRALSDAWIAARQFPLLCDFETPFEVDRWYAEWPLSLDKTTVRHGEKSLQVQFTSEKYSTISLRHFPSDWSGYTGFHFSIFNGESDTLLLTCRINDYRHYSSAQNYNDRFNRRLRLPPGWNDFDIPVSDIIEAPAARNMEIQDIDLISFFSTGLTEPKMAYLDYIYLTK